MKLKKKSIFFNLGGVADLWMSRSSGSSENSKATTAFAVVKEGVHQFYKFVLKCKVRYTDTAIMCDFPQIC